MRKQEVREKSLAALKPWPHLTGKLTEAVARVTHHDRGERRKPPWNVVTL